MMDWSQEETFRFIELFQKESIIWDPKNKFHKYSQKVNDAWTRLSNEMCRPPTELKNKKNSLMATFRQHLRRKKLSKTSGAGEDDIYKPVWIYYDVMEAFLASIYKCHTTINTEEGLNEELITSAPLNADEDIHQGSSNDDHQNSDEKNGEKNKLAHTKKIFKSPIKRKRLREDSEMDIQRNIKDTVSNLNTMLLNRKENDECDLYAQLLATRLREYSIQERRQIMHSIDGLLLVNPPKQFNYSRSTPSPMHSLSPSSNSSSYIPDRPTSMSHNNHISQLQQSPVQINMPESPTSRNYISQPQQSPVQINMPDRLTSRNYSQSQQSPVQISILDHPYSRNSFIIESPPITDTLPSHSASATNDTVLPSQNCITILSQEIIQPASQNVINTAFLNASNE